METKVTKFIKLILNQLQLGKRKIQNSTNPCFVLFP